jgi:glutathione peroxidase
MTNVYDYTATDLGGVAVSMEQYRGKVLLIVNTASQCGYTPQYKGLEQLYRQYKDKGLMILGFPCNQFGKQEPGTADDIQQFCDKNYAITFPLFEKIEVNGSNTHPLYQYLKREARGVLHSQSIKWNFTKFLVNKEGAVLKRYATATKPARIAATIEKLLAE